ncbi:MAG: PTS sugar transporter subunit IIB [Elusimicrobia bacterium]|nr:PTS sugar transporter subunit IIB [Elusimicrobiota bacterium]
MPIVLVRIDDRLIHGQVVEGWIPYLGATQVVVVSDAIAQDHAQQVLMRLALPDSVELKVLGLEAAATQLNSSSASTRTLVLAPSPTEILGLIQQGLSIKRVNVGGMHYSAGRVQLGKAIFLTPEDQQAFREMVQRGVALEAKAVPSDRAQDVAGLIEHAS